MNVSTSYIQRLGPAKAHTSKQRGGFGGFNSKSLPFKPDTIRTLDEAMNLHLVGGTMNECAETTKVQDPTGNTCPPVPFSPTPFSVLIRFVAI